VSVIARLHARQQSGMDGHKTFGQVCAGLIGAAAVLFCATPAFAAGESATLTLTEGSRLMLPARINGRAVDVLLDSAAEATLVDRKFAQALKLGAGEAVAGHGSGESSFAANLVSGVTLEALGVVLKDQTVAITDLGDVGRRLLKRRLDAILGREIFDAARLSVDIEGRRIAVVPREYEPRGVRLDLLGEHGVETVPVTVESGDSVRATFDLGNGSNVLVSTAFAARAHLLTDGRQVTIERGGGLGGETRQQVVKLKSLEIAGRRFENVAAAVDPQSSASDVNVGVSILRHFRITTDFAQRAVWLEPRADPPSK
jgi:predicted aspartyl protease